MVFESGQHFVHTDLDAEVEDFVAVVGEDDVDQVLANVVDVAFTVASTIRPRPPWSLFSMCGSSAQRPTSSSRHSAGRRAVACRPTRTDRPLHACRRGGGCSRCRVAPSPRPWPIEVVSRPTRAPSMMRRRSRSFSSRSSNELVHRARRRHSFVESEQHRERIRTHRFAGR